MLTGEIAGVINSIFQCQRERLMTCRLRVEQIFIPRLPRVQDTEVYETEAPIRAATVRERSQAQTSAPLRSRLGLEYSHASSSRFHVAHPSLRTRCPSVAGVEDNSGKGSRMPIGMIALDVISIRINDQWRVCFRWVDGDAHDVEIVDYH